MDEAHFKRDNNEQGSIGAMPTPSSLPQDQNAYFTDPENAAEMARLTRQARMLTQVMGGPLSETIDPARVHDILDVACGPGEWVLETAKQYPDKSVTGVDVSHIMIDYARFQAQQQHLNNAHFKIRNVLEGLEFPDASFDLVNARLLAAFLFRSRSAWPDLIQEYIRVTRHGGIIRLTECEWPFSTSPALEKYIGLGIKAVKLVGHLPSVDEGRHTNATTMLGSILHHVGCKQVQLRPYAVDCSFGSTFHQSFYENMRTFLKMLQTLMLHASIITQAEADDLYQQALKEILSEDFNCIWYYLSAWAERS
jgi:ubiquinone/menaquinone biosynthesis C-methylase UbiE